MTRQEYLTMLAEQETLMGKIIDNTERQVRYIRGNHRSLNGLMRLLAARASLLAELRKNIDRTSTIHDWESDGEVQDMLRNIRQDWQKIRNVQFTLMATAKMEKNNIANKLGGARITQNIRSAYIGRWYQGLSRGFSREV